MTVANCQEPTGRPSSNQAERDADDRASIEGPAIDEAALAELLELDRISPRNVFERVVRIYLDQAPTILRELRAAVGENDPERFSKAAHSLKSSSMNVGAKTLSALCKKLEALGRSGHADGAATLLDKIDVLYPPVEVALQERISARQARSASALE